MQKRKKKECEENQRLFGQELHLDWIIFHDVLVTSRVYVRTVCPIRYDWVKDLLPKLHEIDVYELSSVTREEVTDEEMAQWEEKEAAKRQAEVTEDEAKKMEKRNDESSNTEARTRCLKRKQHRLQRKGT
ncbi:probable ATP-dependent RNA helicase DHX40 [Sinocyclocheilus rhinocerous]|uniref:probable ATP-dependent RNA helicase DHX40 n=1 Tax=Sinocyclocheilus rhinocerous TaxID=307959 RepID=UPI0007BA1FF6|nr:PREDICTED: probable ATP-dependent RNA helicase DHX40 [Sinocyclocheilus rhinocerous]